MDFPQLSLQLTPTRAHCVHKVLDTHSLHCAVAVFSYYELALHPQPTADFTQQHVAHHGAKQAVRNSQGADFPKSVALCDTSALCNTFTSSCYELALPPQSTADTTRQHIAHHGAKQAVRVARLNAHHHQLRLERSAVAVKVHQLVVADAAERL